MKTSALILSDLDSVLTRIRRLQAEAIANEPARLNRRLSVAEENENERRRNRTAQIESELVAANAEATRLRADYALALDNERAPKPVGPSPALQALYKRRDGGQRRLERLHTERAKYALDAAEGDAKAEKSLSKCCEDQTGVQRELGNLAIAIRKAENRDAEERRELADREADKKYRAGLAAEEQLIAWAEQFDNLIGSVGAHFALLPDLQKALAKCGADINTDLTNRLFTVAARDRAAKHAGLHRVFSIDATVDATPLGVAFRSLLRAAIRRPKTKGKQLEHSN